MTPHHQYDLSNLELEHLSKIGLVEWNIQCNGVIPPKQIFQYMDYMLIHRPKADMMECRNRVLKGSADRQVERDLRRAAADERKFANECLADSHDAKERVKELEKELQDLKNRTEPILTECRLWASALNSWAPFYGKRKAAMEKAIKIYEGTFKYTEEDDCG